jgi:hypothetical protein
LQNGDWCAPNNSACRPADLPAAHGRSYDVSKPVREGKAKGKQLINVLLQTTIAANPDDWSIERFGLLRRFLAGSRGSDGRLLFNVTARNRDAVGRPDAVLSTLHHSAFDELWLFAVDTGDGLMPEDCEGISRFRQRGGGLMITRDQMDVGSSACPLAGVGAAPHFHSKNQEADPSRWRIDDSHTAAILWPNYHSGANGDYQQVRAVGEPHAVLHDPLAPGGIVRYLPAHPHEGAVSAPAHDLSARVILRGHSHASGADFNLAVAFENSRTFGPAMAQSTFHHFCDYNWQLAKGAPSFVSEVAGDGLEHFPEAVRSTQQYVRNVALWLAGRSPCADAAVSMRSLPCLHI